MSSSRRIPLLAALAIIAALAGAWYAQSRNESLPVLSTGTWFPNSRALAAFELRDSRNAVFGPSRLAGSPALLFFGFTHCPDVCPTTLALLAALRREAKLPDLRVVFVSVDPQRDTPEMVGQYVAAFDPQFIGLTGELSGIDAFTRDMGVAVARTPLPGGGYSVDHSATIFLTDRRGRLAAVFTPPFNRTAMIADLRGAWPALQR